MSNEHAQLRPASPKADLVFRPAVALPLETEAMRKLHLATPLFLLITGLAPNARADLCNQVQDGEVHAETEREADFFEQLFLDGAHRGSRKYNEVILECNRKRDTNGNEISNVLATSSSNDSKQTLLALDLDEKIIRGKYNFFGMVFTQQKYRYVLSKSGGVWTMIIPYNAVHNELVANRTDFFMGTRRVLDGVSGTIGVNSGAGHAWDIYERDQVDIVGGTITLKADAQPIATTLCSRSTFFPGDENKYDGKNDFNADKRDLENKHIDLGLIQYRYDQNDDPDDGVFSAVREGCRVNKNVALYWDDPDTGIVSEIMPQDWILDNFVRVAEAYWSQPTNFELRLMLKGRNEGSFSSRVRNLVEDGDFLTVRFATKFMPHGGNQMYKSNPIQFNNFSSMTTDGTLLHEVGHAFGLDDEYGDNADKLNHCENDQYSDPPFNSAPFPRDYQMCNASTRADVTTIYHYIAVSRYITRQNECDEDDDCGTGEWCHAGIDLVKNECRAKRSDGDNCPAVGGGHACWSNHCKFGTCYTPDSVDMGAGCFVDDQCISGRCSSVAPANGTCVCDSDYDCGSGRWCDAGLDLHQNQCLAKRADWQNCPAVGGGHACLSGNCRYGRCFTDDSVNIGGSCFVDDQCRRGKCSSVAGTNGTCVCLSDSDCGSNAYCHKGTLGIGLNRCVATRSPTCPSGWSYQIRNPLNKDRCNRTVTRYAALKCKLLVTDKAKNWTGPHAQRGADECRSKKGKSPKGVKCPSGYTHNIRSGADTCTKQVTEHRTPTCPSGWDYKSQSGRDVCRDL